MDDGSVLVKITGCEYRVTEERLKAALSHWGSITTDITEEVFTDPHDSDGTNRTEIYTMRMIMDSELPEVVLLDGLRLKMQYRGVTKLCTGGGPRSNQQTDQSNSSDTRGLLFTKEQNRVGFNVFQNARMWYQQGKSKRNYARKEREV